MKRFLLFSAFVASLYFSEAQVVSFGVDFENALNADFKFHGAAVEPYAKPNVSGTGCTSSMGLVTGPSLWSSGQNNVGFVTEEIQSIGMASIIKVSFSVYTFNAKKNDVTDCSKLASAFPCTITAAVSILAANGNSTVYGTNTVTIKPGVTTILVPINANISTGVDGTPFRIMFDVNNQNTDCAGVKDVTFVVDDLSVIEIEGEQAPLPVDFNSFNAVRDNSTVSLNWSTVTEQDNLGFYVQRNDGGEWKNVGFVSTKADNGNSTIQLDYNYTETNNNNLITQYRIVQLDKNGKTTFTDIRSVRGLGQNSKIIVYPNPSKEGNVNIVFDDVLGSRSIIISDMVGRFIRQWKNVTGNSMRIDNLHSGMYHILVQNNDTGERNIIKLVVNQ